MSSQQDDTQTIAADEVNNTLLIVEDNPADTTHYLRMLEDVDHGFSHIECVETLRDAELYIQKSPPACCLLDVNLPDGSALLLLKKINAQQPSMCPVVVVTGQEDTASAIQIMRNGAQDYLIKQELQGSYLLRVILSAIKTWGLQQQLNRLALYDSLTGLVNRGLFIDRLSQLFENNRRYKQEFALLYIDMDRFKFVNDTHGHEAGDYLLTVVADQLRSTLRQTDTAARLGGDEFAVILPNINEAKAYHVAHKLVIALTLDTKWQTKTLSLSPSIGLATYPGQAKNHQDFMREADVALYRAKKNGKGQFAAFNKQVEIETRLAVSQASAFPRALLDKMLQLAFQPIIHIETGDVVSVEALVRWKFKNSWVSPERIINLMLERRMSDIFHQWLFDESLSQLKRWQITNPELSLTLNLPANLCNEPKIVNQLLAALKHHEIAPQKITVEVTETHLIRYPEETKQQLNIIAEHGIQIAIDDFGTGYSSMQYLASLPCHLLKIDKDFFIGLYDNPRNQQIIKAITALAHSLNMKVVAEGIENANIYDEASKFGCDYGQGYWMGSPTFSDDSFDDFLKISKNNGDVLCAKKV